ncbi:PEP-CTERM sorting domain-containing protein [Telluria sp. B2]
MKKFAVALALAGLSLAGSAGASTITFSEAGAINTSFLSSDGSVKVEYVWSTGAADGHSHLASIGGNLFEMGHGQAYQGLRFSSVAGGALTLSSFDFQGTWTVSGLNDGSGTTYNTAFGSWITQNINLTSSSPIYIYATGNAGGYLDNVVFGAAASDVPEPASMALMLLGAVGLAGVRRKARK